LARTRRLGDNAGMARDDSWAQVLRLALPILDEARPSGMLGWVPRVAPVVTQAAVGAGHWAAGRRRRALAAWTSAAGYGLVAWGLGTEAPTPAEVRENMQQNIQRLQREGVLRKPGTKAPAAAGTQTPADLRGLLDGCPMADDVILCASELAANAAVHSNSRLPGGQFTVRAEIHPGDYVWLEVEDNGGPWIEAAPDTGQGHGLDIIRALASDCGIDGDYITRIVWARFDWPTT
jgi:hypothetical protein